MFRFKGIKRSGLAAPRFREKIRPDGWRFFFEHVLTLGLGEEPGNTFALEMGHKAYFLFSPDKVEVKTDGIEIWSNAKCNSISNRLKF